MASLCHSKSRTTQESLDRAPRSLDTDDIKEGAMAYLTEHGIRQVEYRDEIEWRFPNESEIAYFDLPADRHIQWSRSGERF